MFIHVLRPTVTEMSQEYHRSEVRDSNVSVFGSTIIQSNIRGNVPQNLTTPVTVVFATPRDSRKGGKDGKDGKGGGMKGSLADSVDFSL